MIKEQEKYCTIVIKLSGIQFCLKSYGEKKNRDFKINVLKKISRLKLAIFGQAL